MSAECIYIQLVESFSKLLTVIGAQYRVPIQILGGTINTKNDITRKITNAKERQKMVIK